MAQQCPISAPLVVKDLQGGVVGFTGTIWSIAPDCTYQVARQVGLKVSDPHKHGQLTAEQQQKLAGLLQRADLARAPDQHGAAPQANARQVTISYGQTTSTLTLPPGSSAGLPHAAGSAGRETQFLDLVDALGEIAGR